LSGGERGDQWLRHAVDRHGFGWWIDFRDRYNQAKGNAMPIAAIIQRFRSQLILGGFGK
jgi:hypothetical protein